jgi:hypothetical protein
MPLAFLLILVLGIPSGATWLATVLIPDASELTLISVAVGSLIGLWLLMVCLRLIESRRRASAESLERRARRLAEESNRRYRASRRQ